MVKSNVKKITIYLLRIFFSELNVEDIRGYKKTLHLGGLKSMLFK